MLRLDRSLAAPDAELLWLDGDRATFRARIDDGTYGRRSALVIRFVSDIRHGRLDQMVHEFRLKDILDGRWALRPSEFWRDDGALLYEDRECTPLLALLQQRLEVEPFLRVAIAATRAVGGMHSSGIIHKDLRPGNLLANPALDQVWIAGFGSASLLPRERRSSMPPDEIEGTLEYMAPEQTGRMNRSVDTRSDLYALGVTLYQLLTGHLPFTASGAMEWIHCHVARQPTPPRESRPDIPPTLASIVLKLIQKSAELRYQTAEGLGHDLERCLAEWSRFGCIQPFDLGSRDFVDELRSPEELYGRNHEIRMLRDALNEVVTTGTSRLVLVSGYSGSGKTSVVNELKRTLVPTRGLFATGKFDQFKRDIPYSSAAQAFQGLVKSLLSKEEAELGEWRGKLSLALGAHGELIVNLVPELVLIVGKQPAVPPLSGPEAQTRLMSVFEKFVDVFAQQERPLVLFLDDLQWLDLATLDLFTHLATRPESRNLLLVGAYRDNEVEQSHPLAARLELIREENGTLREVPLREIAPQDVRELVADLLTAEQSTVEDLSRTVAEKAGGNPFHILQFMGALVDDGLLVRASDSRGWSWDLERIDAKKISENVVDLMVERLGRLPQASLQAMKIAACVGGSVDARLFHGLFEKTEREVQELLREPLRAGLLLRVDGDYAFAHDRVQEAAYALMNDAERTATHRRLGCLLLRLWGDDGGEHVFDIVDQLNRAELAEADGDMRTTAASLNLVAGKKAKSSCAYPEAMRYFSHGMTQLGPQGWPANYGIAFGLSLESAECTFLAGDLDGAEHFVEQLLERAETLPHRAAVYRLKIELHVVRSQNAEGARTGLAALRLFGIDFPEHPGPTEVEQEFEALWGNLGERPLDCFSDLPPMTDPDMLALMRLLAEMWPPSFFTDFHLTTLVVSRMVNISLEHGIAPSSIQGLALFGWIMGPALGRYDEGYMIVKLACDLAERQDTPLHTARVFNTMGFASSWTKSLATSIDWYRAAYRVGVEAGDVFFACFSSSFVAMTQLQQGSDLRLHTGETYAYLAAARATGFRDGADMVLVPERASACLRGLTVSISDFSDADFDEAAFEAGLEEVRAPVVGWFYWTRKVMLHYLAGEFEAALRALERVHIGTCKIAHVQHVDYHFYGALACAALIDELGVEGAGLRRRFDDLRGHLRLWAEQTASSTFAGKDALLSAEAARLGGGELEAQRLYEESIRLSAANGFVQDQGVANEVAARYYERRGFDMVALAYLKEARRCFQDWGATAKVRLLDSRKPLISKAEGRFDHSVSMEQLDLTTVTRVLQAISGEMMLERLIDTVMRASIEHAGAERVVLVLEDGIGEMQVIADASTQGNDVSVNQQRRGIFDFDVPRAVLFYVKRTSEAVVLENASLSGVFGDDPHISGNRVRSLLCLPLTNQGSLIGMLYLENNLSPGVFTPRRLPVLRLLASQVAIALENTRLYGELQEREARIRRLVDSNVIGIVIWDRNGRLLDANGSFLDMTQYSRDDLERGLGWYDMTPPDWQNQVESELHELTTTGAMQPREKEFFRRDGSRVKVLIGAAAFDAGANQGVAYILDLTEREDAERKAVESERRVRELQTELAHANRVETVGQLSTWIAHDVRQPLIGIVASASAGTQWLGADPPNLEAARRSLERVEEEGHRAAQILDKIRALMKKSTPSKEIVDLNELVLATLPLLQSEVRRRSVKVRLELTAEATSVSADRIQLQQVLMNMMLNAIDALSVSTENVKELIISTSVGGAANVIASMRDTGPALPLEEYERFFEAFYSTKEGGLGIGLAICKNILENFGGRIWAEPCEPHGTAVRFSLPMVPKGTAAGSRDDVKAAYAPEATTANRKASVFRQRPFNPEIH